jgi:hypothetical protein
MKPIQQRMLLSALALTVGCLIGCNPTAPTKTGTNVAKAAAPESVSTESVTFFVDGMV